MDKKTIGIVVILVIVIIAAIAIVLVRNNKQESTNTTNVINQNESTSKASPDNEETTASTGKVLVVYFSAQNHTASVAQQIASNLKADIFKITPREEYTEEDLDWTNDNSRVSKEHNDETLQEVDLVSIDAAGWEDYETILVGYPIWWGEAAWPAETFVKANDFTGKTVIPFCTSASSELGQSGELLEKAAGTGNWQTGKRFSSSATKDEIKEWTDSLGL